MLNGLKFGLAAAAVFAVSASADACWGQRNCCAPTVACAPPYPPPAPQYVERKVTAYKCVVEEREVDVTVDKYVPREVAYKYIVNELVTTPVKQKVIECQRIVKEVEYKYIDNVVTFDKVKKMVTTWKCESHVVQECVPVCRKVLVRCPPDPCAGCLAACLPRYHWETVMETKMVCRTVVTRTPMVREVECLVRKCTPVEKIGKRMVCELKPIEKEIIVNVCACVPKEMTGKQTVYDCVPTKTKVKQSYTVMKPYETTVKVLVGGPAPCPPAPRCCGLFGR